MIQIDVFDEVSPWLRRKAEAMGDFRRPLAQSQRQMLESTQRNFQQGGRPTKWTPLAASTIRNRPNGGTRPLIDTGDLRGSIDATRLTRTETAIGTNKVFAATHQFGATIQIPPVKPKRAKALSWMGPKGRVFAARTKAHSVTIPARPFFVFQSEDRERIVGYFSRYILEA